jgi:2-oxo-4-hydroxy-4-carboxy-5-ureidoimidazoline decarboxylase
MRPPEPSGIDLFDRCADEQAADLLRPCCASRRWIDRMLAGRPYGTLSRLDTAARAAVLALDWPDVEEALAAHPRIGERASGPGREAAWSRSEQSGTAGAAEQTREALRAGNAAYEMRFGHVYLVRATGRTADELLADLTARLDNDPATEQHVVRRELAAIVALRLARALAA